MNRLRALVFLVAAAALPRDTLAYSVFAHEANIDALWDTGIRPLLEVRYPRATTDQLRVARAYAYGGSVIQDLGYYPFGSRFFSNLLHYVRTGDFIESMLRRAQDINEYAFALGLLAHYAADNTGHSEAVNRSVALMFPKLRARFGESVTYAQARSEHVVVEFSFDVVQLAAGAYAPDTYHRFIGFEVSNVALARSFREIYGLEMGEVLSDQDLAIATYRHAVSEIVPELTRVAWRTRKEEISRLTPGIEPAAFIYRYGRKDYEREFAARYRRPGLLARFIGLLYRVIPKIGPLEPLRFKTPSPEAERLFAESFRDTRVRYAAALRAVGARRFDLANTDLDTGRPSASGEYELADRTYFELLAKLAHRRFENLPPALRANISNYYAKSVPERMDRKQRKRAAQVRHWLGMMTASNSAHVPRHNARVR